MKWYLTQYYWRNELSLKLSCSPSTLFTRKSLVVFPNDQIYWQYVTKIISLSLGTKEMFCWHQHSHKSCWLDKENKKWYKKCKFEQFEQVSSISLMCKIFNGIVWFWLTINIIIQSKFAFTYKGTRIFLFLVCRGYCFPKLLWVVDSKWKKLINGPFLDDFVVC